MSVAERFGKNVAAARRRGGHSQEAVALRASLHRTEIGLLERGERMPRLDTAIRLAGALDVSLAELTEGITWKPGETTAGSFSTDRSSAHRELMERAAAFRARQSQETDVAALAREAREELEERGDSDG